MFISPDIKIVSVICLLHFFIIIICLCPILLFMCKIRFKKENKCPERSWKTNKKKITFIF